MAIIKNNCFIVTYSTLFSWLETCIFFSCCRNTVVSNEVEIVWDQVIATDTISDKAVGANRPDILIHDKKKKKVYIIDISCLCDTNV